MPDLILLATLPILLSLSKERQKLWKAPHRSRDKARRSPKGVKRYRRFQQPFSLALNLFC
jgi:hypothetical protein